MEIVQMKSDPLVFTIITTPTEYKLMKKWSLTHKKTVLESLKYSLKEAIKSMGRLLNGC